MTKTPLVRLTVLFSASLLLSSVPMVLAQGPATKPAKPVAKPAAKPASKQATKVEFISDLDEPQGLVLDGQGNILLADYGSGSILRYSRTGQPKGTLATGLKSPSLMVNYKGTFYVAERKNNRVVKIGNDGKVTPVGGPVPEPLGLTAAPDGTLFVVSHTTSQLFRFDGKEWREIFKPTAPKGETERYGYRCLTYDNGSLLLSDEGSGSIYIVTQGGRHATWVKDLENPSGILVAADGTTYLTDESQDGGALIKVAKDGTRSVIATELGRARDILVLDAKTLLVSSRDGIVWKITLPA
jgi:sugar lactone lactonase YvrE